MGKAQKHGDGKTFRPGGPRSGRQLRRRAASGEPGVQIRHGAPRACEGLFSSTGRRTLALFQIDEAGGGRGFLNAAREALGFDLPTVPGTSTGAGARAALWTGPNRWTIRAPEADKAELGPKLSTALIGRRRRPHRAGPGPHGDPR